MLAGKTWRISPLHMWMEDAIVELMENHCKTVRSLCMCVCLGGTYVCRQDQARQPSEKKSAISQMYWLLFD